MKYLKPLELFMEMRKPCMANRAVIGVTYTNRYLCLAMGLNPETFARQLQFYPKSVCAVEEELLKFQNKMPYNKFKLVGLVVGKNHVGAPMNLIDDLSKTGKFESLKYTYWVDNITSKNTEAKSRLPFGLRHRRLRFNCKDYTDGFSAYRMLYGYMDVCNTLVERPKKDFDIKLIDRGVEEDEEEDEKELLTQ